VDGVKCHKFVFIGLISMMCLIVRIILADASRFVVGALHLLAPLGYGTSIYLEEGTGFLNNLIYF